MLQKVAHSTPRWFFFPLTQNYRSSNDNNSLSFKNQFSVCVLFLKIYRVVGRDSRSRNLHHFLFPRRIMVLQTSLGFQSEMFPPCPFMSGKHTLNTFKHKTICQGLAVRVPGSFSCFASQTFLDFSLLPPALFNIRSVCLGLVWTIRMNWLCVLRQASRTDDLEMSTVKKNHPALFASDFKKYQNTVLLISTLLRKGGAPLLICIRSLFWSLRAAAFVSWSTTALHSH